jgi:hypothetical protein
MHIGKVNVNSRCEDIARASSYTYTRVTHRLRYLGNEIDCVGRAKLVTEYQVTIKSVRPVKQVLIKSILRTSVRTISCVRIPPIQFCLGRYSP